MSGPEVSGPEVSGPADEGGVGLGNRCRPLVDSEMTRRAVTRGRHTREKISWICLDRTLHPVLREVVVI